MKGEKFVEFMNTTTAKILVAVAIILLLLFIYRTVAEIRNFKHTLQYIKTEIGRTAGKEREYWQKKKKKLWLSLFFPFI